MRITNSITKKKQKRQSNRVYNRLNYQSKSTSHGRNYNRKSWRNNANNYGPTGQVPPAPTPNYFKTGKNGKDIAVVSNYAEIAKKGKKTKHYQSPSMTPNVASINAINPANIKL